MKAPRKDLHLALFGGGTFALSSDWVPLVRAATELPLAVKLQPLIVCLNRVDASMRKNHAAYRSAFPARLKGEQNGFFSFKIEPYESNNSFTDECANGLDASIKREPSDGEMDAIATSYAAELREIVPTLNEAETYYSRGDYRDDKMKKGRDLDAKLEPQFQKLFATSTKMREVVAKREMELRAQKLAEIEKSEGRQFEWHTLNAIQESRLAYDELSKVTQQKT